MEYENDDEPARLSIEVVEDGDEWTVTTSIRAHEADDVCDMTRLADEVITGLHAAAHREDYLDKSRN